MALPISCLESFGKFGADGWPLIHIITIVHHSFTSSSSFSLGWASLVCLRLRRLSACFHTRRPPDVDDGSFITPGLFNVHNLYAPNSLLRSPPIVSVLCSWSTSTTKRKEKKKKSNSRRKMEDGRLSIVLIYKNPRALPSSPISDDIYMNHTRRLDGILVGLVSKYLAQSATSKTTRLHLWEEPLEIEKGDITYELGLVIYL